MGLKSKIRNIGTRSAEDVKEEAAKTQPTSIVQLHASADLHLRSQSLNYSHIESKFQQLINSAKDEAIVREIYTDLKFPSSFSNGAITWSIVSEVGRSMKVEKQTLGSKAITYEFDGKDLFIARVRS